LVHFLAASGSSKKISAGTRGRSSTSCRPASRRATEYFCPQEDPETGECEVPIEEAPESLTAAPGFDSMTGIGSPGEGFIQAVVKH